MNEIQLSLHPKKVSIATIASGVDFLGWEHFPHHRVLRTATKKRMMKNVKSEVKGATVASYVGMLGHGNGWKLVKEIQGKIGQKRGV